MEQTSYPASAVERAMKVQEVILRAIDGRLKWYQAADRATMMPKAGCSPRPPRRSDRPREGGTYELSGVGIVDPRATGEVTSPAGRMREADSPPIGGPSLSGERTPTLPREEAGLSSQPDRSLATTTGHLDLLRTAKYALQNMLCTRIVSCRRYDSSLAP